MNKPWLRGALYFWGIPPPFSAWSFVQKYFLFFVSVLGFFLHFSYTQDLLCQRDRASGCLRQWSSRSCNMFYDYLVCEQLCSRRGKYFHLPRVAKSLELALVISVTSLKPILSHFKCKEKKVQLSQLNSGR